MKKAIRSIFAKKRSKDADTQSSNISSRTSHTTTTTTNNNNTTHAGGEAGSKKSLCQGVAASNAETEGGVGSSSCQDGVTKNQETMTMGEPKANIPQTIPEIIRDKQCMENEEDLEESTEGDTQYQDLSPSYHGPRGNIAHVSSSGNSGGGNGGRRDVGGNSGTTHPIEGEGTETRSHASNPRRVGRSIYGKGNPYLLCGSPLLRLDDTTYKASDASGDDRTFGRAASTELITLPIRLETSNEHQDRLERKVASALSSARPVTLSQGQGSKAPYSSPSLTAFGGRKSDPRDMPSLASYPLSSDSDEPDTESSTAERSMRKVRHGHGQKRYYRKSGNNRERMLIKHYKGDMSDDDDELESIRYRSHAQEPLSVPSHGRPLTCFSAFNLGYPTTSVSSSTQGTGSRSQSQPCHVHPKSTEMKSPWKVQSLDDKAVARKRELYKKDVEQYMQDNVKHYKDHPDLINRRQEIYEQARKFATMMAEARALAMQNAPLDEQFSITFEQITGQDMDNDLPRPSHQKAASLPCASIRTRQASLIPVPARAREQRQSLPIATARGGTAAERPSSPVGPGSRRHSNNTSRCTARRIIYTEELERGLPKGHIARENHYEIVQTPRDFEAGHRGRLSATHTGSTTIVIRPGGPMISSLALGGYASVPSTATTMATAVVRPDVQGGGCSYEDQCVGSPNDQWLSEQK
ncbi:hypothetical protein BGX31_004950 [Mortierella sp. GBA43]|nr:hypothetical protein BGX31_004950 [Mortierella sp. GBA43]